MQVYATIILLNNKKQKKENTKMEMQSEEYQAVTKSDILRLDTWNRQRSSEELMGFVARKAATLSSFDEL